jgi:hypothetical protein
MTSPSPAVHLLLSHSEMTQGGQSRRGGLIRQELAERQICRTLLVYPQGLPQGQLFARIECSIGMDQFLAALARLIDDGAIQESSGRFTVVDRTKATARAA